MPKRYQEDFIYDEAKPIQLREMPHWLQAFQEEADGAKLPLRTWMREVLRNATRKKPTKEENPKQLHLGNNQWQK
jgi:hypothetical protein